MQVDLHIHSTASDGTWTPPEVVAAALAAGLELLLLPIMTAWPMWRRHMSWPSQQD